jgi:hypothetical protein
MKRLALALAVMAATSSSAMAVTVERFDYTGVANVWKVVVSQLPNAGSTVTVKCALRDSSGNYLATGLAYAKGPVETVQVMVPEGGANPSTAECWLED